MDDRQALYDLMVRYTYAVDSGEDIDDFLSVFTEDAVLQGALWQPKSGLGELEKWARTTLEMRKTVRMRHYLSNISITATADTASMHSYLTCVYRSPVMEGVDARTVLFGEYLFEARRVAGSWLLNRRVVRLDVTDAGTRRDVH